MTDIVWGEPIEVSGVRPEWLEGQFSYRAASGVTRWYGPVVGYSGWNTVGAIRLPATHDYYKAISRGFTYWPGGESAPEDWDGGLTLMSDGRICAGHIWRHNEFDDIIGYRKRTEQPAPAIAPELVERMVRLVRNCAEGYGPLPYIEARSILAELEPDPDLTLAKSIMGDAEAIALAIKAARENAK